jgi:hypothetical protein
MEFGERRDLAIPPPLHAAKPHGEIFDPALVPRESEENKPSFVLPYGMRQKENATNQIGNVMDKPGHVSELHVQEIGGSQLVTVKLRELSAGKLKCQRLHDD